MYLNEEGQFFRTQFPTHSIQFILSILSSREEDFNGNRC